MNKLFVILLVCIATGVQAQVNVGFSGTKGSYTFSKKFKTLKDIPRFSEWDSLPNGKWNQLYEGGQVAMEYTMKNYLLNGPAKGYYPDGKKRFELTMKGNYINGELKEYYPSGQLKRLFTYFEGFLDGPWYMYYEDGVKQAEGHHKQDLKVGKLYHWYPNGVMKEERSYVNDTLNGYTSYWYETGKLKMHGDQYTDDKKVGKWEFWYEDGTKHKESEFVNNVEMVHNAWDRKGKVMVEKGFGRYQYYTIHMFKLIDGHYDNSFQHGQWFYWDEQYPDRPARTKFYVKGKEQ